MPGKALSGGPNISLLWNRDFRIEDLEWLSSVDGGGRRDDVSGHEPLCI